MVADIVAGFVALDVAYSFRSFMVRLMPLEVSRNFNPELLPFREYFFYFAVFLPLWVVLLRVTQRYSNLMRLPLRTQCTRSLQFVAGAGFFIGFFIFSFKLVISRPVFFVFLVVTCAILITNRLVLHWVLRSRNINEHNQVKILVVGTDARARRVGELLESFRLWGYRVVGYLSGEGDEEVTSQIEVLGSIRDLPKLLQEEIVADEILFVGSQRQDVGAWEEVLALCDDLGIRARVLADFFPASTSGVSLEFLEGLPLITFSARPEHRIAIVAKRLVDFVAAALLLILLTPFLLCIAVLVKFTSLGPVLYRQVRCGLYGRKFTLVKFRTMVEGAEDKLWEIKHLNEMDGPVFKMRDDPRITPLGRWLRKSSIDELPQLWNVIKGEMSLVGPRAPVPEEVKYYSTRQRRRLCVKPGITCLWQVSGRSDIDFHRWMDLDLQYIDNWSFWLDVRIMLKTIPVVFTGRGAR
jgi:exopolysaccharide biosynthesis polyprenyl glycosylphosphotransferase